MNIEKQIINSALEAVNKLYGASVDEQIIQIQKTRTGFEGNLTLVAFPLLKISRKKPDETAPESGEHLKTNSSAVEKINVVSGFLTLVVSAEAWINLMSEIDVNEHCGDRIPKEQRQHVMIQSS